MALYAIYQPNNIGKPELLKSAQQMRAVPDGLNVWAFAFPLLWLVFKRMWFSAAIMGLIMVAAFVTGVLGAGLIAGVLFLGVRFFMLLEANQLYASTLSNNDHRCVDFISADSETDAVFLYLNGLENSLQAIKSNDKPMKQPHFTPLHDSADAGLMLFGNDEPQGSRS